MIEIKETGNFLYPNKDGIIERDFPEFQADWKEIVVKTIQFYRDEFGDKIHSIYIRGSVASGVAVKYASDLDTYCVMKDENFKPDSEGARVFNHKILEEHPYCLQVELMAVPKNFILDNDSRRTALKTQAKCVYGEDLSKEIEEKRLIDMYQVLPGFRLHAKVNLPRYLEMDKGNSSRLKSCCSWMMKNLLRSAFELIMLEEGRWTNGLYLCHSTVAARFPEMADHTFRVLELALNPIDDADEITRLANKFYDFFEENLGLAKTEIKALP